MLVFHNFEYFKEIVDLVVLALLLIKLYQYSENIRPFVDGTFSKHHTSLARSFRLLISTWHIFGIILFSVPRVYPENNWTMKIGINDESWDTQYIYSIYWAMTTIVTAGYGDITPCNKYEVLVVILIKIIGTSMCGYMINVIGMTLTEMQKKRGSLDNELSVADKLCKHFSVNNDLSYRIKNFLVDSYKEDNSFSLAEEAKIMEKLNPALQNEILKKTNSKILQKSLFFSMHFTCDIQNRLQIKLIKRVLQPKKVLQAQDTISIVDQGELDIKIMRYNHSRLYTKYIKTIEAIKGKNEIKLNTYDYTGMITGRKVNTKATSRLFTVIFELKKKDLQSCIQHSQSDYEALYELKDDLLKLENLEAIEIPQLTDSRIHHQSNKFIIAVMSQKSPNQRQRKMRQC